MTLAANHTRALGPLAQLLLAGPNLPLASVTIHRGTSIHVVLKRPEDVQAWADALPASIVTVRPTEAGDVHHIVETDCFGIRIEMVAIVAAPAAAEKQIAAFEPGELCVCGHGGVSHGTADTHCTMCNVNGVFGCSAFREAALMEQFMDEVDAAEAAAATFETPAAVTA